MAWVSLAIAFVPTAILTSVLLVQAVQVDGWEMSPGLVRAIFVLKLSLAIIIGLKIYRERDYYLPIEDVTLKNRNTITLALLAGCLFIL
jgi:hypothetical protein